MSATYTLEAAFNENVAGVFTVDGSALDGADGLTDVGLFDGTYDNITGDVLDPYSVVMGTDHLMAQIQAANLTVKVARVDNPPFYNANDPASPLNSESPGFVPMRPVRLYATVGGTDYGIFRGFIRHATWDSDSRSCELYCEDLLLWASRVYPTIASTGPTNVGQVVTLLFQQVDPTVTPIVDPGISLDDFSADGTRSVTSLLSDLLAVDLGTVYVNGDGVPVYEQHDTPLARAPAATITVTDQASTEQSGIDLDSIGTRSSVTKTDAAGATVGTWTSVDAAAEKLSGRADLPAVSSPYVGDGQALADELVLVGTEGKPPLRFTLADVDDATLLVILQAVPLEVYTVDDSFGGSGGDVIVQQITRTISTGLHQAELLCAARAQKAFTVDGSALDGPDGLRYP